MGSFSANLMQQLDGEFGGLPVLDEANRQTFADLLAYVLGQEICYAFYNTASQNIPNATSTTINFATKIEDTDNAVTTGASWKFTCPTGKDGLYVISSGVCLASGATIATAFSVLTMSDGRVFRYTRMGATGMTGSNNFTGTTTVRMVAGQTAYLQFYQNTGGTQPLESGASSCWITIARIPGS